MITLDFETRSEADLLKVGAYEYARHPSTEVMCIAYAFDDGPVELWHPEFEDLAHLQAVRKVDRTRDDLPEMPEPTRLLDNIENRELVEAHNAFFERCIWHFQIVAKLGWPAVRHEQWRCSAAKAASYSLRRKLEHVAADLGICEQKDMAGHRLMQKMSKPRRPTLRDPFSQWHQKAVELHRLFDYCKQDVRTERALSDQLAPMPDIEIKTYLLDQKINWRGIHCDRALVEGAIKVGAGAEEVAQQELEEITYGLVDKVTQKVAFLDWLEGEGIKPPMKTNNKGKRIRTTEADGIDRLLARPDLPEHVRRACEIWRAVTKTSVKKYAAFQRRMSDDDRVRETLLYYAASTGRWGGRGVQPQNLTRDVPKNLEEIVADVTTGDHGLVSILYGEDETQGVLSRIVRGVITAPEGYVLQCSDFSSIEARGTFWVSGHKEGLDAFREIDAGRRPDIYCWQAEQIFGYPVTKDMPERQSGKVVVLGCGYQMGWEKLITYADGMGVTLTDAEAKRAVRGYRDTNWPVVDFWKDTNRCAIEAVDHPGKLIVQNEHIAWGVQGQFLRCRLPSGRLLSYLHPAVIWADPPWDGPKIRQLTFMGTNTYTRQWERTSTYGGKLTENIVQALCRDIMRDAMLRTEAADYPIVLTVHDEVVAEVHGDFGSQEEYDGLLTVVPEWAQGFPIVAEGFRTPRYKK